MTDPPRSDVERVWRSKGSKLWRALLAYSGDPELASDATAEAFAQALGRGDEVHNHDPDLGDSLNLLVPLLHVRSEVAPGAGREEASETS